MPKNDILKIGDNMKKTIIGGILILIGLFCLYGYVSIKISESKANRKLEDIVFLSKNEYLEENENKLVILSGQFIPKELATDDQFNTNIISPVITRFVEYYKKIDDNYRWEVQYEESEKYKYKKEIFTGSVSLGEFTITGDTLIKMSNNKPYQGFNKYDAEQYNLKLEEHKNTSTYLTEAPNVKNEDNNSKYEDKMRIYYTYYDMSQVESKTIVGTQRDHNIVSTDDFEVQVYDGTKSQTEVINSLRKTNTSGELFSLGAFLLFEIFGVYLIITRNKDSI